MNTPTKTPSQIAEEARQTASDAIDTTRAYRFGPAEHALVTATLRDGAGSTLDRAFFFPQGLPASRRRDVGLEILGIEQHPEGGIVVSVSAQTFAQSVYFDADGYLVQDEYFHLAPGETRAIRLIPSQDGAKPATSVGILALNAWSGATLEIAR